MPDIISCQRDLFDIPDEIAWFNCAYLSPLLRASLAALPQLVEQERVASPALIVIGEVTGRPDRAVQRIALEAAL